MRGMRERIRAARGAGGPTAAPPAVSVTLGGGSEGPRGVETPVAGRPGMMNAEGPAGGARRAGARCAAHWCRGVSRYVARVTRSSLDHRIDLLYSLSATPSRRSPQLTV